MIFIVYTRSQDDRVLYYTGRAGQAYVSENREEAFGYSSASEAGLRQDNLNRAAQITGLFFRVCPKVAS